jgi:hypothetical protein
MSALVTPGSMPESSPRSHTTWYPKQQMSYLRSLSATLLSAATTFSLVSASSSCGTSAVGVDDCRDIEQARCRAGKTCGIVDDVPACERFYRDHCLHGLATKPPAGASAAACVQVIEAAGRCAANGADGTATELPDCPEEVTAQHLDFKKACDVVKHPEKANECSFLTDTPDTNDGVAGQGAGGNAGSDDSGGGAEAGQTSGAGAAAQAGATG